MQSGGRAARVNGSNGGAEKRRISQSPTHCYLLGVRFARQNDGMRWIDHVRTAAMAAVVSGGCFGFGLACEEKTRPMVSLFNGKSLEGWTVEHSSGENFKVADGVLRVEGPKGWLRSTKEYQNFVLHVEFRFLTDDADSGVFVRAAAPPSETFFNGWPSNSYQVQTREMSKNQSTTPIWLGDIFRHPGTEPGKTDFNSEAVLKAM